MALAVPSVQFPTNSRRAFFAFIRFLWLLDSADRRPEYLEAVLVSHGQYAQPHKSGKQFIKDFPLQVDGIFGPLTHARVIEFQKSNELQADGIVGPDTRRRLGL